MTDTGNGSQVGRNRRAFMKEAGAVAGSTLLYSALGTSGSAHAADGDALGFESAVTLAELIRTKALSSVEVNGETVPYFQQLFWAGIATVSYLPSTVFPTGLSKDGLPIGLQVIGAEFDDHTTMEFARLMAEEIGGFQAPPGYAS